MHRAVSHSLTWGTRLFLVAAAFALAACTPRDPLDWKIDAATPAHYNTWSDKTLPQLDAELRREFTHAFFWIASKTPGGTQARHMTDEHTPLCKKLHGRTLREIILQGYRLEKQALLERIGAETDMMLRNLKRREKAPDAKTEARFDRVQDFQGMSIEKMNERLGVVDAKLRQFDRSGVRAAP